MRVYQGVVRHGQIELDRPADLPEGNQVFVLVVEEGPARRLLDPHLARRKANGWLVTHVGSVLAQQPRLERSGDRLVWQFRVFLTVQGQAPRGPVGTVNVDVYSGDVETDESAAAAMIANAAAIAETGPSTDS